MSNKKYEVRFAKMSEEMQRDALQCVLMAEYMYEQNSDIANYIAKEFERKHKSNWFCMVGNFGNSCQSNCYVCFSDGSKEILLFKP